MTSAFPPKLAALAGTRHLIWLGAIALSGVMAAVSIYEVAEYRERVLTAETERLLQGTAAAEDMLTWRLGWARHALENLADTLVVELDGRPDVAVRHARRTIRSIPMVRAVVVARPDGAAIATTADDADAALFPILRSRINPVEASPPGDDAREPPTLPPSGAGPEGVGTGTPRSIIVLSFPILDDTGMAKAWVAAAPSPSFLDDLTRYATPDASGASAAIVTGNGRVLTRWPDPEAHIGREVGNAGVLEAHLASGLETTAHRVTGGSEGTPKLIVARNLDFDGLPRLTLLVTRELSDIDAAWISRAYIEAGQTAVIVLVVLSLAAMAARREQALRAAAASVVERENLYHNLFHGSKAAKLLIDPADGRIVDANLAATTFYGWPIDRLREMRIGDINVLPPEEVAAEMERARQESRNHFQFRHRLASGEIRDVEVHSGPLSYGNRSLLYSLIIDVTERRRMELERQRLVTAIEQSRASVVITDVDGRIEYVNPAFTNITGYSLADVKGKRPNILKSGHTSDDEYTLMWRTLSSGRPWSATFLNKRKDGSTYWEYAHISPVLDTTGNILNYVAVKENITALKMSEDTLRAANERLESRTAELARANQELEQFAYVASHDLRQPLRAISSYLRLLRHKLGDGLDAEAEEFIQFAEGGAKRMDALIVGLLEYSRVGRLTRAMAPVALGDVVATTLNIFAFEAADRGARITVAEDFPTIVGSEEELQRLFDNLVGNALKYRDPERAPEIEIGHRVAPDGEAVEIWVSDNGIGMAPENHDRAFGMFQRLVGQEEYEGTGIGLAVCRKIVQHHDGDIRIESELGRGCRVVFRLPLARDVADARRDGRGKSATRAQ